MSVQQINQYFAEVEKTIRYGGMSKETAVRSAFQNLLTMPSSKKGCDDSGKVQYLSIQ